MALNIFHSANKMWPFLVLLMVFLVCLNHVGTSTAASISATNDSANDDDPYLWLENVTGERALSWVHEQNAISTNELERSPDFEPIRKRLLAILDSKEKIPYVSKHGKYYYNFWRDQNNVRGLWRRTTLEEFKKPNPNWEVVLD